MKPTKNRIYNIVYFEVNVPRSCLYRGKAICISELPEVIDKEVHYSFDVLEGNFFGSCFGKDCKFPEWSIVSEVEDPQIRVGDKIMVKNDIIHRVIKLYIEGSLCPRIGLLNTNTWNVHKGTFIEVSSLDNIKLSDLKAISPLVGERVYEQ